MADAALRTRLLRDEHASTYITADHSESPQAESVVGAIAPAKDAKYSVALEMEGTSRSNSLSKVMCTMCSFDIVHCGYTQKDAQIDMLESSLSDTIEYELWLVCAAFACVLTMEEGKHTMTARTCGSDCTLPVSISRV